MGFVAPPDWRAVGVCTAGLAHRPGSTAPVRITLLVDRGGASASVLHHDEGAAGVEVLPGRSEGIVADACRRALGLPTRPPPQSSLPLWTATWLDRVVTAATGREPGRPELSWAAVARLHPASTGPADPITLALAAAALAEAWPWHRLRAEPSVADVVGAVPDAAVAAWMDDGMWARRVAEGLAPIADLLDATRVLLAPAGRRRRRPRGGGRGRRVGGLARRRARGRAVRARSGGVASARRDASGGRRPPAVRVGPTPPSISPGRPTRAAPPPCPRRSRARRRAPRRCAGRPSAPWWASAAPRPAA